MGNLVSAIMKILSKPAIMLMMLCGMVTHARAQAQIIGASTADSVRSDTTKKVAKPAHVRLAPKGPKAIKNEVSFGLRLHTSGWSIYTDMGKVKARNAKMADMFYDVNFWQIELSEKKSPKQEKITVDENASGNSGSYKYGKINNFYSLKLGYGMRKMIAGKPDPGSVSIHWSNVISGSLGMLKPYYLNVRSDPNAIKYSDETQSNFLDQRFIVGSAGFGAGLSEMKMIPGGGFKSMLHFDFASNRKGVTAVETGINFEYYSADVPLMALQKAEPYFFDLFIAVQFGKRW
jgi:hypothetical protein